MKKVAIFILIFVTVFLFTNLTYAEPNNNSFITAKDFEFFDKSRSRSVLITAYVSEESEGKARAGIIKLPVVIINHGYSVKNTEYSFIANAMAARGYFVVSIQHDLKSDRALAKKDNIFQTRKPLWDRGAANILFTITQLKKINSNLNLEKIILIGHSNGGDISMIFTEMHPELVKKVISLDSLRYPFPTKNHIPILSLRANDTKADDGVLPGSDAIIVKLENAKHIDLCDRGPFEVKQKIIDLISSFIEKN